MTAESPTSDAQQDASPVRPYLLTGGRTRVGDDDLPLETVVETESTTDPALLGFERRAIAENCRQPQSIAEVAGALDLPLGVARVLVTDMADEGLLRRHRTGSADDLAFIEQLREGIRLL